MIYHYKHNMFGTGVSWIITILVMILNAQAVPLGPVKTQVFDLEEGWNSIHLSILPVEVDPNVLFEGSSVKMVATYYRPVTNQQFFEDPNEQLQDRANWLMWYSSERDDAVLTNLKSIQANRSYLVYADLSGRLEISGVESYDEIQWSPNTYNHVGFNVDSISPPTISNFFEDVLAHSESKIYQLVNGNWSVITNPQNRFVESGIGYWVFSAGASTFASPLAVDFSGEYKGGIIFTIGSLDEELIITNNAGVPQTISFEVEAGSEGAVPVSFIVNSVSGDDLEVPLVAADLNVEIESGDSLVMNLRSDLAQLTSEVVTSNLIIKSDFGILVEVPLISYREDL